MTWHMTVANRNPISDFKYRSFLELYSDNEEELKIQAKFHKANNFLLIETIRA